MKLFIKFKRLDALDEEDLKKDKYSRYIYDPKFIKKLIKVSKEGGLKVNRRGDLQPGRKKPPLRKDLKIYENEEGKLKVREVQYREKERLFWELLKDLPVESEVTKKILEVFEEFGHGIKTYRDKKKYHLYVYAKYDEKDRSNSDFLNLNPSTEASGDDVGNGIWSTYKEMWGLAKSKRPRSCSAFRMSSSLIICAEVHDALLASDLKGYLLKPVLMPVGKGKKKAISPWLDLWELTSNIIFPPRLPYITEPFLPLFRRWNRSEIEKYQSTDFCYSEDAGYCDLVVSQRFYQWWKAQGFKKVEFEPLHIEEDVTAEERERLTERVEIPTEEFKIPEEFAGGPEPAGEYDPEKAKATLKRRLAELKEEAARCDYEPLNKGLDAAQSKEKSSQIKIPKFWMEVLRAFDGFKADVEGNSIEGSSFEEIVSEAQGAWEEIQGHRESLPPEYLAIGTSYAGDFYSLDRSTLRPNGDCAVAFLGHDSGYEDDQRWDSIAEFLEAMHVDQFD